MELRFIITSQCNFACIFCLNEFVGPARKTNLLLPENIGEIAHVASQSEFINKITISGGEPLIRKDASEIIRLIRANSNLHLTLVTNGFFISRHLEAFSHLDEVHVSFHSMNDIQWQKVTQTNHRSRVAENIVLLRNTYPDIVIKLNIVADSDNFEEMDEYLSFAKDFNLQLSLFKEGVDNFLELARMLGTNSYYRAPAEFWDISKYNPILIEENSHKQKFLIDDINVTFSITCTDEKKWESMWVSPSGLLFVDIEHLTPEIFLPKYMNNPDAIFLAMKSMKEEMVARKTAAKDQELSLLQKIEAETRLLHLKN